MSGTSTKPGHVGALQGVEDAGLGMEGDTAILVKIFGFPWQGKLSENDSESKYSLGSNRN